MNAIFSFMNVNSGALTSLCTVVLTICYVVLTRRLVEEARLTREEQSKPKLLVAITPRDDCLSWMDMIVTNIGNGFAHEVQFRVDPDLPLGYKNSENKDVMLSDVGFIAKGLTTFAPRQTFQFFLTSLFDDFDGKMNRPITVTASYKDAIGKSQTDTFVLDFAQFKHISQLGDPPMETIATSLKEMQKDVHNLATVWSSISVKKDRREKYRRPSNEVSVLPSVVDMTESNGSFS